MDHTEGRRFEEFVRARSRALLRTAFLLTGDKGHAEDLLQTVLIKVSRRWSSIDGPPEGYVRAALVNTALTRRSRRRFAETSLALVAERAAPDEWTTVDLRDLLVRSLFKLPPRQRAVLVLRYFEDLSEHETATALGCSVGTVKSQASRGLVRLRELTQDRHDLSAHPVGSYR